MKKKNILICLLIAVLVSLPNISAKAEEEIIASETKYYKTVSDIYGVIQTQEEITEEEYETAREINLMAGPYYNTAYQKLTIGASGISVNLNMEWLAVPTMKTFDVIALRTEGVTFNVNSLSGTQSYYKNGDYGAVGYTYTSNNTKIFNNGLGISMNLVDGGTNFNLSMSVGYNITGSYPKIYGTYQHATKDISLANSQKYTLSSLGFGKVVLFDSSVKGYYDQFGGVDVSLY